MYSGFLWPCILEPTRIVADNIPRIIDNIFIKTIDRKLDGGNIINKVSDHVSNIILVIDIIEIKKTLKNNLKKYLKKLEVINTMLLLQCNNLNEMFETSQNKFLSIIDNDGPIITLSRKESKLR